MEEPIEVDQDGDFEIRWHRSGPSFVTQSLLVFTASLFVVGAIWAVAMLTVRW